MGARVGAGGRSTAAGRRLRDGGQQDLPSAGSVLLVLGAGVGLGRSSARAACSSRPRSRGPRRAMLVTYDDRMDDAASTHAGVAASPS